VVTGRLGAPADATAGEVSMVAEAAEAEMTGRTPIPVPRRSFEADARTASGEDGA
jgi:hypothetical protein